MNKVYLTFNSLTTKHEPIKGLILPYQKWEITNPDDEIEVSDGYHTMSELYNHRYALFAALVKMYDNYKTPLGSAITCYKSKLHSDGSMDVGYFIVMMVIKKLDTSVEQISYHLPLDWWDKFNIMTLDKMWPWDGHTSDDVIKRLIEL